MRLSRANLPRWVLVPGLLGVAFVLVPLLAVLLGIDWTQFPALVSSTASLTALGLSLRTSAASTVLCVLLGVPLALALARLNLPLRNLFRTLVLLPMVLPPVVGGLALLQAFGRKGLLGQVFGVAGIDIAFTTTAVVLAQTFVSLPFLVLSVEGAALTLGTGYERVATTLGASPSMVLWRITLPLLWPGLASGAVLAFARSLGEFGATLTFAGSLQGTTRTLPLEVYLQRETDPQAAMALSLLLIVLAGIIVAITHRRSAGAGGRR